MVQHKVLKSQGLSCLILFYGLVKLGTYARIASEGGTYHPVCIRLASRMWIPKMLRAGKVAVKVSLKLHSSAGLMLQDLAYLVLWVWGQG